ncbi:MAG: SDR family oxidoreductase [Pseudohongiella sp.]|nr:SDR family oxidoreductase [Pseudohongiella sp.]
MDFTNKTVLVTGGSRGIGKAIAIAFANKGARVAILYRANKQAAEATLAELPGDKHITLQADVADAQQVKSAVDKVVAEFGRLDIVVNNAGIGIYHPIELTNYQDWQTAWQQTLDTNLLGPANVCFCAAKIMMQQGGGRLVNVSSRGAFRGEPTKPAYGASKAALNSLSQSLAVALAPHNIFVGVVAPGFVNTELTADRLSGPEGEEIKAQSPFNRVAEPEEVAHAVLFLASEGAEFSTGSIIDVNGASYLRS